MGSRNPRFTIFILVTLVIVGAGLSGVYAAESSPGLFSSVTSFFQGFFPITGYADPGGGGGSTCPIERDCVLTVSVAGSGTVTSNPAGIACSSGTCSKSFPPDQLVALSKSPATVCGVAPCFIGWSGACTGTSTCSPSMSADRSVTATFTTPTTTHTLKISPTGTGSGTVSSSDAAISCSYSGSGTPTGTCDKTYIPGAQVTLTASVPGGSNFGGWSGGFCTGTGTCTVNMDASKTISATFNRITYYGLALYKSGTGSGTFSVSPAAASSCGADCYRYPSGTTVTITASPSTGSTFSSWTGCSSLSNVCQVTMTGAKQVTATFNAVQYQLSVTKGGTGTGTISSSPAGINSCSTTCNFNFNYNTQVTLTATASGSSYFTGWTGCTSSTNTCTVTMDAAKSVTGNFNPPQPIAVSVEHSIPTLEAGQSAIINAAAGGPSLPSVTKLDIYFDSTAAPAKSCPYTGTAAARACSYTTPALSAGTHTYYAVATDVNSQTGRDPATGTKSFTLTQYYTLTASTAGTGSGTLTSSPFGVNCPGDCTEKYAAGTQVTLTANAGTGSLFQAWGGADSGGCFWPDNKCIITMNSAKTISATFNLQPYSIVVQKAGTGAGTVASSPTGINCGTDCSELYAQGTTVTLTAVASTGSKFAGWSSWCSGTGTCTTVADQYKWITATFDNPSPTVSVFLGQANPSVNQPVVFSVSAADESGLSAVKLFVDSKDIPLTCGVGGDVPEGGFAPTGAFTPPPPGSGAQQSCSAQIIYSQTGTHNYYATATDNGGKTARSPASGTLSFTVSDTPTPPTVTITHSPASPQSGQAVTFTANAQDDSKVSKVQIFVDDTERLVPCTNPTSTSMSCVFSSATLLAGTHTYYAIATDSAGAVGKDPSDAPRTTKSVVVGGGGDRQLATIQGILPAPSGPRGSVVNVVLKGRYLLTASKVTFVDSNVVATIDKTKVQDDTNLPLFINIPAGTTLGPKTFAVTNAIGTTDSAIPFEVTQAQIAACLAELRASFNKTTNVRPGEELKLTISLSTADVEKFKDCVGKSLGYRYEQKDQQGTGTEGTGALTPTTCKGSIFC